MLVAALQRLGVAFGPMQLLTVTGRVLTFPIAVNEIGGHRQRIRHDDHTQRRNSARSDPTDEVAHPITESREQRQQDTDQRMPFTRRPSSRVTSRSAVRRARSWRLS